MLEIHAGAMTEYRPVRTECSIQIIHNSDARQEPCNNKYSRGKTVKAGCCVLRIIGRSEKETCDALLGVRWANNWHRGGLWIQGQFS